MKPINLLLFLLGITQSLFAQYSINGRIIDTYDYGVAFANVLLLNQTDSILVKGAVTDSDGYYTLSKIGKGNYIIESYMIGYSKSYSPLFALDGHNKVTIEAIFLA
jgi:hypothetical protein